MRPFEVGDLVVSKYGIGTVKRYYPTFELSPVFVEIQGHGTLWIKEHEIKTIRKPCKGSKEARDIVAKLTWLYLAQLKKCKKQSKQVYELWKGRYHETLAYIEWALNYENLNTLHTAREVAKSMLK